MLFTIILKLFTIYPHRFKKTSKKCTLCCLEDTLLIELKTNSFRAYCILLLCVRPIRLIEITNKAILELGARTLVD